MTCKCCQHVSRKKKASRYGSWRTFTREFAIDQDLATGAILNNWKNPYSKTLNAVFHVQNDSVNQTFGRKFAEGKLHAIPYTVQGDDVQIGFDVSLSYPNPIDVKKYAGGGF